MHVGWMEVAHEERELGEAHQVKVGFDVAVEVSREGRQRGYQVHPGSALLKRKQQLLLPNRSAEVTQQVAMPGSDVLERVAAVEVLRARGQIHPLRAIAAIAEIVRIVVVEHG